MDPSSQSTPRLLWKHADPTTTRMYAFIQAANAAHPSLNLRTFQDLYAWSVGPTRNDFWRLLWHEIALIHEGSYAQPVDMSARMDSLPRWFEGVRLNYAENMLFSRANDSASPGAVSTEGKEDGRLVITEVREGGTEIREFTWGELRRRVALLSNAMRAWGVRRGDRVAVVASNSMDTLCVLLAVTALGGLFSSSSTDMGTKGVLDRLLQIEPVWVFIDDFAVYNGKTIDLRPKICEIVAGMANVKNFKGVVTLPRLAQAADLAWVPRTMALQQYLEAAKGDQSLTFERIEYNEPFLVVYSSGTTGVPKCIVHSVGGVLTNVMKEGKIQRDLGTKTVGMQYTTTGWIMYLSAISPIMFGGRSVLYDGSPFLPGIDVLIKLIESQKVTNFGISPRYLHELQKNNISPREIANVNSLKSVTSTGMVLKDSLFEWFYDVAFPKHVHLCNISGGTDIAGTFGMENSLVPLYVGGCQGPSIGTPVAVYDQLVEGGIGIKGKEVENGVPGELVATKSFPNMPVFFWGADGSKKYFNSYFARFDDVWTHGDFIMVHPVTKQIFFLGRADGVLNPSGVRFGSAEVYSVLETHFSGVIADSLCVGQRRPTDNDETVLLFLMLNPGHELTGELVAAVKDCIARELSKRHVPKHIFTTPGIPQTINGKKVELPVKQIVSGHKIKPSSTLANPESLEYYYQFANLGQEEKARL